MTETEQSSEGQGRISSKTGMPAVIPTWSTPVLEARDPCESEAGTTLGEVEAPSGEIQAQEPVKQPLSEKAAAGSILPRPVEVWEDKMDDGFGVTGDFISGEMQAQGEAEFPSAIESWVVPGDPGNIE